MGTKKEWVNMTGEQRERKRVYDANWKRNRIKTGKQKERYNKKQREWRSKTKNHLNHLMGNAVCFSLKGTKRYRKWISLVGYTAGDLKRHLEKQFDKNMNWTNYGSYWGVDHITPRSWYKFKSFNDKQFKLCWGLENLRPLSKLENGRKNNRLILENQTKQPLGR